MTSSERPVTLVSAIGGKRGFPIIASLLRRLAPIAPWMAVGIIGTIAGFALGLAFSLNIDTVKGWLESLTGSELFAAEIYFLSTLPAKVDPMEVAAVVAMALVLSFIATLYPAWRAARTSFCEHSQEFSAVGWEAACPARLRRRLDGSAGR